MNGMRMGPIARMARHIILMAGGIVMIAPFAMMVLTSFKPQSEILTADFHLLPERWALIQNYFAATQKVSLLRYMLNGLIVTTAIFTLQVLTSLPAAYALAKLRFRGRDALFSLVLLCLLVPLHATAIPIYILFYKTGIINTYGALILPFALSVFGIFLMRQFFMTVPDELIDAARIDGMRDFGIVWRVMLPTAVPALIAFGIFSVIAHWNDYFWPLIAVNNERLFTPPLGVAFFKENGGGTDYGPLMAAATVTILPLVAAFLIAQRRFIEGITFSGMKG
jgi:multiple sugar transport system permease protein